MITVYTKNGCPKCQLTKQVLDSEGKEYQEVNIDEDSKAKDYVIGLGYMAMPVVEKGDKHFGGFNPEELDNL